MSTPVDGIDFVVKINVGFKEFLLFEFLELLFPFGLDILTTEAGVPLLWLFEMLGRTVRLLFCLCEIILFSEIALG